MAVGLWALMSFVPPDSGDLADAIVVLGRGDELRASRITEVWQLWQFRRAPQIFASGMNDARAIVQSLQEIGVPIQSLSGEECSQNTYENALFTSTLLHSQGVNKIVLVTDSSHMLRSLLTFQSFGFEVIPHVSPQPLSYSQTRQAESLLREYVGLVTYAVTQKLAIRPSMASDSSSNSNNAMEKILDWKCRVPG
jgi:uncharacterized SAM-binding protein YcdF (DUF218 family)